MYKNNSDEKNEKKKLGTKNEYGRWVGGCVKKLMEKVKKEKEKKKGGKQEKT